MGSGDPACAAAASLALSSLADADSEILQKCGVETLVGMAVRASDPVGTPYKFANPVDPQLESARLQPLSLPLDPS
jgi:hypothetical protein